MDALQPQNSDLIVPELYFLISKFLANGPFQDVAKALVMEVERQKMLPKRVDWLGSEHDQTFAELERKYPHIGPQYLLHICGRISSLLEKEIMPSVPGVISLLGAGKQSLLRTKDSIINSKTLVYHSTRLRSMPIMDSLNRKTTNNIVQVLHGRQSAGPITRKLAISTNFYSKLVLLRRTLGHLSAVYCVLFDRSGKYILTGADDLLVKLWSAIDGRLLSTFRGASAEITDIAINLDNNLLAAGSLDRLLRVWDLQTTGPIAVLQGHTGMITSVNFCPSPKGDLKYLVTTSTDGSVAFWQYSTAHSGKASFASKPIQYHEKLRPGQAQMICASFSPGGIFLAAGSADHHVRVYLMCEEGGPKRILETEAHTDTVDSIQWAHNGLKFVSGSKDGMALVWHFESQQWKSLKLNMADRLPGSASSEDDGRKLKVTMVSWDFTDNWVITAVNDYTIKVWNANTGTLHKVMRGHTDELYVLESHPIDPHVLISAGHDGQLFIWDIFAGESITSFVNHIDGQGQGGVFDAKWSPDGTMIAATDSHGHILMYGFGTGHEKLKLLPKELFFHTDYRPLIRDSNHFVMDEQTQTMPHLMPPPFLVDVDGNPYPPILQRMVPGRESCTNEQLIPNIAVGPEGVEVIEGSNMVSDIDRLIAALASRQVPQGEVNVDRDLLVINNRPLNAPRANGGRVGLRRTGDVEGVRQSSGNWQREINFKWIRRTYVRPMLYTKFQALRQSVYVAGQQELAEYKREMRRRPLMINTSNASSSLARPNRLRMRYRKAATTSSAVTPAYRTRAVREREHVDEEEDDPDNMVSASSDSDDSSDLTAAEEDLTSSSGSDTASSDYSDWVANEAGQALEPPKRSRRKPVQNRNYSPSSDAVQNNNKPIDKKKLPIPENGEIPESYRPPEWLSEVIPRKAPYYPQMGDEVVYFRQGHQRYLEAVRSKKVYKLNNNCEPWNQFDLREHEVLKVIGIKYEIRPPRLCCLKLALIRNDGTITGQAFTIKYHDMPDVLDFIVLRQTFDTAVRRLWTPDDRFRCMIDDGWWIGRIEERIALSTEFPNSLFMCFRTRWDNGEYELMSPWDMEPVDENRLPTEVGGAVPVLPEELRATLYQPKTDEWPRGDRDASCRRIVAGLEQVMGLAIADPFLAPVDLNVYPEYAFVVEYPIDLATIKARFENHFYRRITSAQFDVRYLATNAEKFNQSHSHIVKHARIITDLCLRIIKDPNEVDVRAVYHQLVDTYVTSDSDTGSHSRPSTSRSALKTTARRSKRLKSEADWRIKSRELLEMIWMCDDSTPFREPVDTLEHPDYLQCVDTPMDLRTVKEDLLGGNYESPADFIKDMRLIFANSRNYNTNKRSRIYSMTLRLSNLFEDQLKTISSSLRGNKGRNVKKKPVTPPDRNGRGPPKMTTRAAATASGRSPISNDSEDDVETIPKPERSVRRNRTHATNGISSSAMYSSENVGGPSTSSGAMATRQASRSQSQEMTYKTESSVSSSSDTSDNDDDDDDSDGSNGMPLSSLGVSSKQRKKLVRNSDSEDSYKPNSFKRKVSKKPDKKTMKKDRLKSIKPKETTNGGRPVGRPPKSSRANHSDDDDDEDFNLNTRDSGSPKKRTTRTKRYTRHHNTASSGVSEDDSKVKKSKKSSQRHVSDHSYHLPSASTSRRMHLESDSENEILRPTRSRIRKAKNSWGNDDDSHEDRDEVLPKPTSSQERLKKRKQLHESDNSPGEINTSQESTGYRRSARNRIFQDDSDDDQVLSQISRNSKIRTNLKSRDINHSTNGTSSRNRDTSTRSSSSNRQQQQQPPPPPHFTYVTRLQQSIVQEDHSYGEPGPSSIRNTRRTLSRHQRNADELDFLRTEETDPLQIPSPAASTPSVTTASSISGRLRQRHIGINNISNSNASSQRSGTTILGRNISSGHGGDDNDDDDDDDDLSDPDDDKPLQYVASSTYSNNFARNVRAARRRGLYSDDEHLTGPVPGPSVLPRSQRSQKRPYYNEESDDESVSMNQSNSKRRHLNATDATTTTTSTTGGTGGGGGTTTSHSTRSLTNHTNHFNVRHSIGDDNDSDSEVPLSVSSRGRVRKITAKARGLFRD